MKKQIFARLTKVDADNRLVYGTAAAEELDKSGEIFDYDGSVPYFQKWSAEAVTLSLPAYNAFGDSGLSYGNVREMHGKSAAGKLAIAPTFDGVAKTIEVCAKVTDEKAWEKVASGTYTGFSIGGDYVQVWDDPVVKLNNGKKAAKRYIADPIEISLVDNPCMPGATFSYIQKGEAPGVTTSELRKFANVEMTAEEIPVETARVCKMLAAPETRKDATAAGFKLLKRSKELGIDASGLAKAYVTQFGGEGLLNKLKLSKSLYDVMDIASILMTLNWCRACLESEAEWEGDGSPIPGQLAEVVRTLSAILVDLAAEESSELMPPSIATIKAAESALKKGTTMKKFFELHSGTIDALAKAQSGMSAEDLIKAVGGVEALLKMSTHLKEIGKHVDKIRKAHSTMAESLDELDPKEDEGDEDTEDKEGDDDAEKARKAELRKTKLAKAAPALAVVPMSDEVKKFMDTTTENVSNLTKAVANLVGKLENTPAPSRVAVNPQPVDKAADIGGPAPAVIDPSDPQAALKMMKMVHSAGPVPVQLIHRGAGPNPVGK